ncbi:hypothetical protein, partial [uncultured Akkermansia sp.]|uniref:hypothetical protein n=1 Tax=uncultured Akkermansia sp. TaxID=512294 RepID=UPI002606F2EF
KTGSTPNAPHFQDSILLKALHGLPFRGPSRENRFSTGQLPEAQQPEQYLQGIRSNEKRNHDAVF